jgi:negative regulator of genetic competence, sporulation and motility
MANFFDRITGNLNIVFILEYGYETPLTIHRVQEYGKEIIAKDVFAELRKHFK